MKAFVTSAIAALFALLILITLPAAGEETVYEDTLRFHVRAASDSTPDQNAKLLVRDAVLATYGDALRTATDKESAERYLAEHADAIRALAKETLAKEGLSYDVEVSLGEEWFETRRYGDVTLPAGKYTALIITLGDGSGQNFFCMLYPALCIEPALGDTVDPASEAYDEDAYLMVTKDGYAVKLRTLEILSSFFR